MSTSCALQSCAACFFNTERPVRSTIYDNKNKMNILGKSQRLNETQRLQTDMNTEPTETQFQPAVVIVAEIAFAALLLYMSTQPVDLSVGVMAQAEDKASRSPVLTISIPANVAIASTDIPNIADAPIDSALIRTSN